MKKLLLVLLVCLLPISANALTCPNEPAGFVAVTDWPFNALSGGGWSDDGGNHAIVTDGSAPTSPTNVYQQTYYVGMPGGISPAGDSFTLPVESPEIYICFDWKPSLNFEGHSSGVNKVIFVSTVATNSVIFMMSGPSAGPFFPRFAYQTADQGVCNGDLAGFPGICGTFNLDATWYTMSTGAYHKIELYMKRSSTKTSANGKVRLHVDGTLVVSTDAMNYEELNWKYVPIVPVWGGVTGTKSRVDTFSYDHIRVSVPSGSGGSADTTPPNAPTSLASSGVTASSATLSWTAGTDNVGIGGYNIESCVGVGCTSFNAAGATTGTGVTQVVTGLQPLTSYSYRVRTRDTSGNVSALATNVVSFTTQAPVSGGGVTPNTLTSDTFNRADSATLGSAWDYDYYGTGVLPSPQIVGNKVRAGSAANIESDGVYNALDLPTDHWAQITLSTWAADAVKRFVWITLRGGSPPLPFWYQCHAARNSDDGQTTWVEREGGFDVSSILGTSASVTWAAGDVMRCEAIGLNPTTINVYRNGTLVLTTSDATSLTGVRAGFGLWTAGLTTVELDSFSEGDFVGTVLPSVTGLTTDATGFNVTYSGGPTQLRITSDNFQRTEDISAFPGGRYNITWPVGTTFVCVFGIDASGNVNSTTGDYQCRTVTLPTADIVPPTTSSPLPSGALAAGTTQVDISIVTSEAASCRYSTTPGVAFVNMTLNMSVISSTQHTVTVTGLSNGNAYTYYVRCQDVAGNVMTTDATITFSINGVVTDSSAPTQVTGLVATVLNANQVKLTFSPATDNVAVTGYHVYGCISAVCTPFLLVATGTSSPIVVSNLQGNTQYSFKVRAVDAIQNLGTFSDPATVTTPLLDVFKPSRMTGLTAVRVDYETFDLSWDPGVDDQGIAGAAIEICLGDGCTEYKLQFVATFQTTIHVRGLASQLPYYFRGKHIDIAGNVSEEYSEPAKGVPFPLASGNVQGLCACQVP